MPLTMNTLDHLRQLFSSRLFFLLLVYILHKYSLVFENITFHSNVQIMIPVNKSLIYT